MEGIAETTSTDGGQTWSPVTIIYHRPELPDERPGDRLDGRRPNDRHVFLVYTVNDAGPTLMSTSERRPDLVDAPGHHVERDAAELGLYRPSGRATAFN